MLNSNLITLTLQEAEKYSYKNMLNSSCIIGLDDANHTLNTSLNAAITANNWDPVKNSIFNDIHQINADYYVDPNIISQTSTWFKTVQNAVDQAIRDQDVIDKEQHPNKHHIYIELGPGSHTGLVYVPKLTSNGRAIPITMFSRHPNRKSTIINANIDAEMSGAEYALKFAKYFENSPKSVKIIFDEISKLDKITTANASVLRIENNEFRAFNFSVTNKYNADRSVSNLTGLDLAKVQRNTKGQFKEGQHQAVAVMVAGADKVHLENLRLCSFQDTLYLKAPTNKAPTNNGTTNGQALKKTSRTYIRNCYIEGDVDFIFGQGVGYFSGCRIKTLGTRTTKSWVAAPATNIRSKYGFVFDECDFVADQSVAAHILENNSTLSFGRQWFEGVRATPYGKSTLDNYACDIGEVSKYDGNKSTISHATLEAVGKCIIMNSKIGSHLNHAALWDDWNGGYYTAQGEYVPANWQLRFRPVQKNVKDFITNLNIWKPDLVSNYSDLDLEEVFLGQYNNHYISQK